jgi:hypothetical protein
VWTKQHINISALADNQPTVYLRWSYRIIKTGASPMSGWNIDDVEILASVTPVVTPPPLAIQATATNTVLLSWPTNAANFMLENSGDLSSQNWTAVPNAIEFVGTNCQVAVLQTGEPAFFRLRHP